jgi:hypothetical protein
VKRSTAKRRQERERKRRCRAHAAAGETFVGLWITAEQELGLQQLGLLPRNRDVADEDIARAITDLLRLNI